jgi:hypothetical protein
MNIHSGTVCWICLEEGPDKKGEPIVRDCACRGDDAGFAHPSCNIKYATKKCEESTNTHVFNSPWCICPNCNQNYQNDLANIISAAYVSYTKTTYGYPGNQFHDKIKIMQVLRNQIEFNRSGADRNEKGARQVGEKLIKELLALVAQAKEEHNMGGWVRMASTSNEFLQYKYMCSNFEVNAYYCWGQIYAFGNTEEITNTEIGYYKKARDIYNSVGNQTEANLMTNCIDRASALMDRNMACQSEKTKKIYDMSVQTFGVNSDQAILTGVAYAFCLRREFYSIQAERLVTKLAATSRQVFGEDHKCTKQSSELMNKIKRRTAYMACPGSGVNAIPTTRYRAL